MTERERLIELLTANVPCDMDGHGNCSVCEHRYSNEDCERHLVEVLADHLLANGVIVPPCKVGDRVYELVNWCDYTNCHFEGGCSRCNDKGMVERKFNYSHLGQLGKTVFPTKEEAERALAKVTNGK